MASIDKPHTASRGRRLAWRREWLPYLTLGLVLLSLLMNLWAWVTVSRVRQIARERMAALAVQIDSARDEVVTIDIPVKQVIPIQAQVPIQRSLQVPIQLEVPINETFNVPLETPFGTYPIPVPINITVPISALVPIQIDETIEVSTTVDLDLSVPIAIPVAGSPLEEYLVKMHAEILRLRDEL